MINKNPLVTVILTTYNRYNLFLNSYKAILEQSYKNLEIIIIDDCSSEKEYKNLQSDSFDSRTIYIRNKKNKGLANARNTGIKKSKGSFICFCDDDDIWMPNKIELQLKTYFNSPAHVGVVTSSSKVVVENTSYIRKTKINGWFFKKMIGARQPLGNGSTLMFTRRCLNTIGFFDERYKRGIDGEYLYRVSLKYKVLSIDLPLVIYNFDPKLKRITNNKNRIGIKRDIISLVRSLRLDIQIKGLFNMPVFLLYLRLLKRLLKLRKFRLMYILTFGLRDIKSNH